MVIMNNQKIGQYIASKRKEKGLTQKELAEALSVTNKAVSKWETGTSMPDISLLKDLAQILDITVDELLEGEDQKDKRTLEVKDFVHFKITKDMYKKYLKVQMYQQPLYLFITTVLGCLFMCLGLALFLANRYIGRHMDMIGMLLTAIGFCVLLFHIIKRSLLIMFYKPCEVQYSLDQQGFDYIKDGEKVFYFFAEVYKIMIIDDFVVLNSNHQIHFLLKEHFDHINYLWTCSIETPILRKAKMQLWMKIIFAIGTLLLGCLELGYLIVLKRLGFEYMFDTMESVVILCILLFASAFLLICKKQWTRKQMLIGLAASVIFLLVTWLSGNQLSGYQTYYSLSPDLSHQLVLKQSKQTGQIKDLHYSFLCFGKSGSIFDTNQEPIHTLWLNGDNNLVSYRDSTGQRLAYVATYGDRGNGISYYQVVGTLTGNWATLQERDQSYQVSVDQGNIEIQHQNQTFYYSSSQIEQFGTTAIVCQDIRGNAQYVIALNENCEFNDSGLITSDGTITIVDMEQLLPTELFCTTYKEDPLVQQEIDNQVEEQANQLISQMQNILSDDPTLDSYQDTYDIFSIKTSSEDFFEIARLAFQKDIQDDVISEGMKYINQITDISVKAGTISDFYVEMKADIKLENMSTGHIDSNGLLANYRIMQGDGCYLIGRITYRVPGDVHLLALPSPIEKDVSEDSHYYFEY